MTLVYIGIGCNSVGRWGAPINAIFQSISALRGIGCRIYSVSQVYSSVPLGRMEQPSYLNTVAAVRTRHAPRVLLARLKSLERMAGRGRAPRWSARPIDFDILDFGGRRLGHPLDLRRARAGLILPHRDMHRRPFVVVPLQEIAPRWRHPVTGQTVALLRRRVERTGEGRILSRHSLASQRTIAQRH